MKKQILSICCALMSFTSFAQSNVSVSLSNRSTTMSNGIVSINIGSNGRVSSMTCNGSSNLLGSNGVYFDYTAASNVGLNPSTAEIIKSTNDYAEVLYSNTSDALRFQQGFIMRKGVSGFYTYIIVNGTSSSSSVNLREARVCVRLASTFLNGYVDDSMRGRIPSNSEMAVAEKAENTISDATYYLADGSVYTKYNWANYIVNDSVHGLMNDKYGVWNIACSHEWANGGPMKQELTVHATSKSPISIQMLQGEHFGASSQYYQNGEKKIYGPFFIYVNSGTQEEMIADAKAQAHKQEAEWPFQWFDNALYPLDRATVTGHLNVTTVKNSNAGVQLILAEPGKDPYLQGKSYMYWAKTDANGDFCIENVRKGEYTLYGYATKGEITDELQVENIVVDDEYVDLGTVIWEPTKYATRLFMIGQNNRLSNEFCYSNKAREYGLWNLPPANHEVFAPEIVPSKEWYYAQTQNGTWTIKFEVPKNYTGTAHLTASLAGSTSSPTVTVSVNGTKRATWKVSDNDAAIYRSAVQSGRHTVVTCDFPASDLKIGDDNKITLAMSGIKSGGGGGIMYDCIKLEVGDLVVSGTPEIEIEAEEELFDSTLPIEIFTINGVKIKTVDSLKGLQLNKGLYIYRQGNKTGKILF